ncbi:hypothetical protein ACFOY4_01770 [Actinomadura syzygii]|uniref:Secreted protein n=2 Tax=Actinomadura syzygii TaxID=1427538 RepID=A0A5D0TS60_9ACTN|nr:hypothetical protein FXF65_37175 [Actinomadura syzygii]
MPKAVAAGGAVLAAAAVLAVAPQGAHADAGGCSDRWGNTPNACITVYGAGTKAYTVVGSISLGQLRCDLALMLYGTLPNGQWWGDAKRVPCGEVHRTGPDTRWRSEHTWSFNPPKSFKADTQLCVKYGIYNASTATTAWDNGRQACIWIEA